MSVIQSSSSSSKSFEVEVASVAQAIRFTSSVSASEKDRQLANFVDAHGEPNQMTIFMFSFAVRYNRSANVDGHFLIGLNQSGEKLIWAFFGPMQNIQQRWHIFFGAGAHNVFAELFQLGSILWDLHFQCKRATHFWSQFFRNDFATEKHKNFDNKTRLHTSKWQPFLMFASTRCNVSNWTK